VVGDRRKEVETVVAGGRSSRRGEERSGFEIKTKK
jgi:hypothetical protein